MSCADWRDGGECGLRFSPAASSHGTGVVNEKNSVKTPQERVLVVRRSA
jgi:hypothetical protein